MTWEALAVKQLTRVGDMDSREALRLVTYWQGRLPPENQKWRPVLRAVIFDAPERKRITSRLIASDRLLKLIYGETLTRPQVTPNVQVAVVNYIESSAREMQRLRPDATPPDVPNRILDAQVRRLARTIAAKPATRKGIGIGLLLLLAVIANEAR